HLQATHIRLRKASNKTVLDVSLPTKLCSLLSQLTTRGGGESIGSGKKRWREKWHQKQRKVQP
ncbi:unnamed protein product, partial [Musa textilis]